MNEQKISRPKARWIYLCGPVLLAILLALALTVSLVSAARTGKWGATELQLQNTSAQPQPVAITWYDAVGNSVSATMDVLECHQSKFYAPELPGLTGAVHVDAAPQVLGAVTHLDDTPPGAAQWGLIDDTDLITKSYAPYFRYVVTPQPGEPFSSLTLHNLETRLVTATLKFYHTNGAPAGVKTNGIEPLGTLTLHGAGMGFLPQEGEFAVVVEANGRIQVSVERTDTAGSFSAAAATARRGYKLAAPLFMVDYWDIAPPASLDSVLAIQNPDPVTATGVLTYYYEQLGVPHQFVQLFTLAPGGFMTWTGSVGLSGTRGHVVVKTSQPVAGLVLGRSVGVDARDLWDYAPSVLEPEQPDGLDRRAAFAPAFYSNLGGWNSSMPIVNVGTDAASVLVKYIAPSGDLSTTTLSLLPHTLQVLTPILPIGFEHASAHVISDQPIASVVWSTSPSGFFADRCMAYEMQYAPPPAGQCIPIAGVTFVPTWTVLFSPTTFTPIITPADATQPITYTWNFGDGSPPVSGPNPTHTFDCSSLVVLTATNGCSQRVVAQEIEVFMPPCCVPPETGFTYTLPTLAGLPITFTNTTTGCFSPTLVYTWNFGDGSPLEGEINPTHIYAAAGEYTVWLTASMYCGCNTWATGFYSDTLTIMALTPPHLNYLPLVTSAYAIAVHQVVLTNTMPIARTFWFAYTGNTWPVTLSDSALDIGPGLSATVLLTVEFPSNAGIYAADAVTLTVAPQWSEPLEAGLISSTGCRFDFAPDQMIDIVDVLIPVEAFGGGDPYYDIDHTGAVEVADILFVIARFGAACP